jgi:hypothetical protein
MNNHNALPVVVSSSPSHTTITMLPSFSDLIIALYATHPPMCLLLPQSRWLTNVSLSLSRLYSTLLVNAGAVLNFKLYVRKPPASTGGDDGVMVMADTDVTECSNVVYLYCGGIRQKEATFGETPSVTERVGEVLRSLRVFRIAIVVWNLAIIALMLM